MKYKVSDIDLTSVADAIRTKGGTSASLSFPEGFVTAIGNISTTGGATLITKNITSNGTYNASSDSADGYSSVTVAIPSVFVTGTFTGSTSEAGGIKTISVPYAGSGYPLSLIIYPTPGSYKSGTSAYTSTQEKALVDYAFSKSDSGTAPDYDADGEKNQVVAYAWYKYSSSDATNMSTSVKKDTRMFTVQNPVGGYSVNAVKFSSNSTMKVWIANTNEYGFIPEIQYTYHIVYSS